MVGWVKKAGGALADVFIDRFWIDPAVALFVPLALATLARWHPSIDVLASLDLAHRVALYSDFMSLANTLGAGIGVGFTVYVAMTNRGVERVKAIIGDHVMRMWLWAFSAPFIGGFALMLIKAADADAGGIPANWVHWAGLGAAVLVLFASVRVLYVFYSLATLGKKASQPTMPVAARSIGLRQPVGSSQGEH